MTTLNRQSSEKRSADKRSFVHSAALAFVWLAMATSGFVFSEPCPTDLVTAGLIVLLPLIGLVRFGAELGLLLLAWVVVAACGLIAATAAIDAPLAVTHTLVTLFLCGGAISVASFIGANPEANLKLIFSGLACAAAIAAATGSLGYFGIIPGAETFTKFGRASGTFKDPNVFGPFLVPPFLYMVHLALERPLRRSLGPIGLAILYALAIFLSFSRGAWINVLLALATFLTLAFATAATDMRRRKIMLLALAGLGGVAMMIAAVTQIPQVQDLLADRASVAQGYDVGPEGRFGGQQKAINLVLERPFGIGAQQFAPYHHHEAAHNVYISMFLNAGWLGGLTYAVIVMATIMIGIITSFKRSALQPFQLIAVAGFIAIAGEGAIIDTDHWRQFYLLTAIVWGIAAAPLTARDFAPLAHARTSRITRILAPQFSRLT